jgi:hypothetical protein
MIKSYNQTMRKFFLFLLLPINALATTPDSTHGDWNVYKNDSACYISSMPVKQDGNYTKRDTPYAIISYKKSKVDEMDISSGYTYKKDSEVEIKIKGQKFKLFTQNEDAWAKTSGEDNKLITAMQVGDEMVVKGISHKGTYSVDTYSLKGISKAYKRMNELCNK